MRFQFPRLLGQHSTRWRGIRHYSLNKVPHVSYGFEVSHVLVGVPLPITLGIDFIDVGPREPQARSNYVDEPLLVLHDGQLVIVDRNLAVCVEKDHFEGVPAPLEERDERSKAGDGHFPGDALRENVKGFTGLDTPDWNWVVTTY